MVGWSHVVYTGHICFHSNAIGCVVVNRRNDIEREWTLGIVNGTPFIILKFCSWAYVGIFRRCVIFILSCET
jgi:hypothetical protein